jgi:hypothetical protein
MLRGLASCLPFALLTACAAPASAAPPATPPPIHPLPAPPINPETDPHGAFGRARTKAVQLATNGDYEGAAKEFTSIMPILAKHSELADEFWAHNAMMMVREAQGDPAAALAENDQATIAAARGTWMTPEERSKLALQKDRWHRAYLVRMMAEQRTGSAKQALIQYAEAALADYRPIGYPDSIAILEAYFAALDGKKEDALAAAKKIDAEKNGDVEDLYLVVVGLEAGGDKAAAENVRAIMRKAPSGGMSKAIMLHWVDLDTKNQGFTPWHPTPAK